MGWACKLLNAFLIYTERKTVFSSVCSSSLAYYLLFFLIGEPLSCNNEHVTLPVLYTLYLLDNALYEALIRKHVHLSMQYNNNNNSKCHEATVRHFHVHQRDVVCEALHCLCASLKKNWRLHHFLLLRVLPGNKGGWGWWGWDKRKEAEPAENFWL